MRWFTWISRITWIAVGFTSLCPGCSRPRSGVIEQIGPDGVLEIIATAPEPLPPPWELIRDLTIGVEYGEEAYMLRSPGSYLVTSADQHIIFDTNPAQLRIYDSNGTFLRAFGQPGQGPGDLPRWLQLDEHGDGIFSGWSSSGGFRIQTWNPAGELLAVHTLPVGHPFQRKSIRWWDGRMLYAMLSEIDRSQPDRYNMNYHLVKTDLAGASVDTIVGFSAINPKLSQYAGMVQAMSPGDLVDTHLLTGDGRLCYSNYNEDWIRVFDLEEGREEMRFRWKHDPGPIPEALLREYREEYGPQFADGLKEYQHLPWRFSIEEGPEGEIWIQRTYEPNEEGLWPVDVFDRGGIYRGRLMAPVSVHTMQAVGRTFYAIGTVGEAPALVRYRLVKR